MTVVLVIVFLVVIYFFMPNRQATPDMQSSSYNIIQSVGGPKQRFAVPSNVSRSLQISGFIEPINSVTVLAPFDGVIKETLVKTGENVKQEQVLAVLDTNMIDENYRKAQSEYIKAKIEYDKLKSWENGAQMLRSNRSVEEAKTALNKANRDVIETTALYKKGIIARMEVDVAVQDQIAKKNALASAEDELKTTQQEGDAEHLEMARLEFLNSQTRLQTIETDRENSQVKAPITGIVTDPPKTGSDSSETAITTPGKLLQKGAAIYNISDITSFMVVGEVDEIDINSIHVGQKVIIQSEAMPGLDFDGKLVSVSAEAVKNRNYGQDPKYKIHATFKVDDETAKAKLRLGMSARMIIQTTPVYEAIIVPLDRIIDAGTQPKMRIKRNGVDMTVDVEIGMTTPEGIEVIKGLEKNDEIL